MPPYFSPAVFGAAAAIFRLMQRAAWRCRYAPLRYLSPLPRHAMPPVFCHFRFRRRRFAARLRALSAADSDVCQLFAFAAIAHHARRLRYHFADAAAARSLRRQLATAAAACRLRQVFAIRRHVFCHAAVLKLPRFRLRAMFCRAAILRRRYCRQRLSDATTDFRRYIFHYAAAMLTLCAFSHDAAASAAVFAAAAAPRRAVFAAFIFRPPELRFASCRHFFQAATLAAAAFIG
jgi:hypothetical protein